MFFYFVIFEYLSFFFLDVRRNKVDFCNAHLQFLCFFLEEPFLLTASTELTYVFD